MVVKAMDTGCAGPASVPVNLTTSKEFYFINNSWFDSAITKNRYK